MKVDRDNYWDLSRLQELTCRAGENSRVERAVLASMIRELATSAAVIVVEHDMDFVRSLEAETIVLHQGELFARGSIEELRRNEAVLDVYLGRRRHVRTT